MERLTINKLFSIGVIVALMFTITSCGKSEVKPELPKADYTLGVVLGTVKVKADLLNTSVTLQYTQGQSYQYNKVDYKSITVSCVGSCIYTLNGREYSGTNYFKF